MILSHAAQEEQRLFFQSGNWRKNNDRPLKRALPFLDGKADI
jgi:hypothetical protein